MMFQDTWDDVKWQKNDFVSKTKNCIFQRANSPLKPMDMALESLLKVVVDVEF